MNGKTHVAISLAAAAALGCDPLQLSVAATLALAAGALLPDLDHRCGAKALRKALPPLLRRLARRMLAGLGVANIRDYLAVVFALMGIARFIAKPPVGAE